MLRTTLTCGLRSWTLSNTVNGFNKAKLDGYNAVKDKMKIKALNFSIKIGYTNIRSDMEDPVFLSSEICLTITFLY